MWKNRRPPLDLLSGEEVNAIHEQAMTILEEIGVDFLHDRPFSPAGEAFERAATWWRGMASDADAAYLAEHRVIVRPVAIELGAFELRAELAIRTSIADEPLLYGGIACCSPAVRRIGPEHVRFK